MGGSGSRKRSGRRWETILANIQSVMSKQMQCCSFPSIAVQEVEEGLLVVVIFEGKTRRDELAYSTEEENEERHGCHFCRSFSHIGGEYPEVSCPVLTG